MSLAWATRDVEARSGRIVLVQQHRLFRSRWRLQTKTPEGM